MKLAEAPKDTKTVVNPAMNSNALTTMDFLNFDRTVESVSCSMESPVMYEMYEGTSGNTQGDTNDSKPAEKAATREIFVIDCDKV